MKRIMLLSLISLVFITCKKELSLLEKSGKYCDENMEFTCSETLGDFYFSGKINGEDFCVSADVDGYWMGNGIGTGTTTSTSDPTLSPGTTPFSSFYGFSFRPPVIDARATEDFAPFVTIWTPFIRDTTIYPDIEYFKRFVKEGDLELWESDKDRTTGFYFRIAWNCTLLPGYEYYKETRPLAIPGVTVTLSPSTGKQDNAVFRISELKISGVPGYRVYDITFEIECDLYYENSGTNDRRYYGRLEDGIFKTQVVMP